MSTRRQVPAVFAMLLCAAGTAASAATGYASPVSEDFTFRFAPAELSSPAGVEGLYGRLVRETRRACQIIDAGTPLWREQQRRACQAELIDKVVARIDQRVLSARHGQSHYFRLAREIAGRESIEVTRRGGG